MKKDALKKFKKMFEGQKANLLFTDKVVREDFLVSQDDRLDDIDQASADMEKSMRMR